MRENTKVFISYSHETEQFSDRVLDFANRLRSEGIDANIDQYEDSPSEGWPRWMDNQIRQAEYVLVICTESLFQKLYHIGDKAGKGVTWEVGMIYQHLYDACGNNTKFIPILFGSGSPDYIPTPLKGSTYYYIDNSKDYDKLYWRLRGVKSVEKPPLGELRPLPAKQRKKLFATSLIDVELWDKAKWRGTFFFFIEGEPPHMGFIFEHRKSAEEIFKGWMKIKSEEKTFDELRVAIIEGEITGEESGYYVHVNTNFDTLLGRTEKDNFLKKQDAVLTIGRFNRMNPSSESKNLEMFKKQYKRFGTYYVMPVVVIDTLKPINEKNIALNFHYRIKMKDLFLRHVDEVEPADIDSVVIPEYRDKTFIIDGDKFPFSNK